MPDDFDHDEFGLYDLQPLAPDSADLVSAATVGAWLGLTSSRIQQLARDGILTRLDHNGQLLFPLKSTVLAYCENTRSAAARRAASPDMDAAKLALTEANARKVELQNDKAAGDLLPVQLVRNEWLGIVTDLRSRLLAVPQRVAANLSLDRAVLASIDAEIRNAMADLVADATNSPDSASLAADSTPTHTDPTQTQVARPGGPYDR